MSSALSVRLRALSLALLAVPFVASAAEPVTRGSFIVDAVNAFNVSPLHTGTLPYRRVPAIQRPYVQAAYAKGALTVFGDDLQAGRGITRGEAVQVIMGLSGMTPAGEGKTYGDVRADTALAKAVALAVEQQWFKPLRTRLFGVDRPLTAAEHRLLLKRIARSLGGTPAQLQRLRQQQPDAVQSEQSKVIDTVWQLLQKDFLYKDRLDTKRAGRDAAEAMVKSLNDPYTVYMPPVEAQQFQQQIHGELTGIGVQVEHHAEGLLVVAPLTGSPAERAGVRGGDVITEVNGDSLKGLGYQEAVTKVRGPKGSTAKVTVLRDGRTLEFAIVRDTVKLAEVSLTVMQGDIAVVKVNQFGETTEREIRGLFQKAADISPSGLILDLRNNPGGLLHAADVLMSAFVPNDTVIANIHTRDGLYTEQSDGEPLFSPSLRVYVLVNKGSASASEIIAGAFQDTGRGTVVGETTFGKGTVQQIVEFRDGSSLKMTIAEWKTPKDRKIDGVGVTPDVVVDSMSDVDAALKKALELLR